MSLYYQKRLDPGVLGIWRMEETEEELRSLLGNEGLWLEAQQRFKAAQRRREWLAVRVLLKELCGVVPEVDYLPSGRPVLRDGSAEVSFSHTQGYVAVIVGPQRVGIDIEQVSERIERLESRIVGAQEVALPYEGRRTASLLLHWSAKETMFKCMDAQEVDFREHLHIVPFSPQAEGRMEAQETRTEHRRCFAIDYRIERDFVLTYTVLG